MERNAEHYADPTAGDAIKNVDAETLKAETKKGLSILKAVRDLLRAADFALGADFVIKSQKTGRTQQLSRNAVRGERP